MPLPAEYYIAPPGIENTKDYGVANRPEYMKKIKETYQYITSTDAESERERHEINRQNIKEQLIKARIKARKNHYLFMNNKYFNLGEHFKCLKDIYPKIHKKRNSIIEYILSRFKKKSSNNDDEIFKTQLKNLEYIILKSHEIPETIANNFITNSNNKSDESDENNFILQNIILLQKRINSLIKYIAEYLEKLLNKDYEIKMFMNLFILFSLNFAHNVYVYIHDSSFILSSLNSDSQETYLQQKKGEQYKKLLSSIVTTLFNDPYGKEQSRPSGDIKVNVNCDVDEIKSLIEVFNLNKNDNYSYNFQTMTLKALSNMYDRLTSNILNDKNITENTLTNEKDTRTDSFSDVIKKYFFVDLYELGVYSKVETPNSPSIPWYHVEDNLDKKDIEIIKDEMDKLFKPPSESSGGTKKYRKYISKSKKSKVKNQKIKIKRVKSQKKSKKQKSKSRKNKPFSFV
jgi:hypothetical protein